jgi:MFS family permease
MQRQNTPLPARYKWSLLAILTLVYAVHSMDRTVVAVVLELVKKDFELTDGQAGALGGLTWGLAFCLCVIPIGWLADRSNRRNLLAALVGLWSLFTLLLGQASSFTGLLLARVGVGAAEAGGAPVAMSLMSDVFPAKQRSTAVGFLYFGLALGQGGIFLIGGYLASHYGWRSAVIFAGLPGLLLAALIMLLIRETPRGAADAVDAVASAAAAAEAQDKPRLADVFAHLKGSPALLLILAGATFCAIASAITWMWLPSLLARSHALEVAQVGMILSIATGLCSGLGSVLAGPLTSWLVADGRITRLGYAAAGVALLATPLGMTAILTPNATLAIACVFGLGVLLGAWLPPAFGLALAIAPTRVRASTMSVIQFSTNLFAGALAPFAVGLLSDAIGGEDSLMVSMGIVFPVMFLAALAFFASARSLDRIADADRGTLTSSVLGWRSCSVRRWATPGQCRQRARPTCT